jgi:hypothetical protein
VILGGKNALFAQKIFFCEKVASGAKKRKFCSQNGKKEEKGVQNTKETTGFVVVCAMGPEWSKKSPQNAKMRTFSQKGDFARQKRFWREKSEIE